MLLYTGYIGPALFLTTLCIKNKLYTFVSIYSMSMCGKHAYVTHIRLQKMKEVKRQRSMEKKHKVIESRKNLTNVRVVQKNLVFVIGLSPRLADPEVCVIHVLYLFYVCHYVLVEWGGLTIHFLVPYSLSCCVYVMTQLHVWVLLSY